jgi:N-acetylglutamate synthase-like GNAT family acetyltransferase
VIDNWDTDEFHDLIEFAKEKGGNKLYCLGNAQRKFYEGHGFETVESLPWLEEYRPEGWNEAEQGRPNCYYLELRKK